MRPESLDRLDAIVLSDLYKQWNIDHKYDAVKLHNAIYTNFLAVIQVFGAPG